MKLLVAGASAVDAGKTTFSVGRCRETGATGFNLRAGTDYWYDHDGRLEERVVNVLDLVERRRRSGYRH